MLGGSVGATVRKLSGGALHAEGAGRGIEDAQSRRYTAPPIKNVPYCSETLRRELRLVDYLVTARSRKEQSVQDQEKTGAAGRVPAATAETVTPTGKITIEEIQAAYQPLQDRYGPIIFLEQAAEISGYTRATLLKKLSQGAFANSVVRGRPVRVWRDRFVLELMNPPRRRRPGNNPRRSPRSKAAAGEPIASEATTHEEACHAVR